MFPRNPRAVLFLCVVLTCLGVYEGAAAQRTGALPVEDALRAIYLDPLSRLVFSPDDQLLAYVVRDNRRGTPFAGEEEMWRTGICTSGDDIWVVNTETGGIRNLTQGKGTNWLPTWSPDGRFLAFVSDRDGSGQARLWILDTVTNEMKKVSDVNVRICASVDERIEWTTDSRSVFLATVPMGLSADEYVEKVFAESQTAEEQKEHSTVHVYRSSAAVPGIQQRTKSPFLTLNLFSRDLAKIDVETGEATTVVQGQRIGTYRLSPDGSHIAYSNPKSYEKPGSQQILYDLATVTIATNQERVVASDIRLDFGGAAFSWSPNGTLLSYHTGGTEEHVYDCYIVSGEGGPPRNITHLQPLPQRERMKASVPLWDTAEKHVYFVRDGGLWQSSVSQGEASQSGRIPDRRITRTISQSSNLLWTADDGKSTVVEVHDDAGKQDGFYKIHLTNGESTKLLERGECYTCGLNDPFQVTHGGQKVAYVAEDGQHEPNLWIADAPFRNPRRLTHLNPQFEEYKLGAARLIDWLSDDGDRLHGALLLPSDYQKGKRYPLVVWVYGGAFLSNDLTRFGGANPGLLNMQLLATRGYAVLLPDSPRHEGTPMADLAKTVLPGVNKVIDMGVADPERLGVMGHSDGGYSTLALIVQTKRFKAAVEMDGMGDLVAVHSEMGKDGSAYGTGVQEAEMGGSPWQFRERYIENSPYFYFDRVETPLLIVHSAGDPVVASFLGDQTFVGLRRLGKEVEYAKYEDFGHLPGGGANELDLCNRFLAWFDKYLKPE